MVSLQRIDFLLSVILSVLLVLFVSVGFVAGMFFWLERHVGGLAVALVCFGATFGFYRILGGLVRKIQQRKQQLED